MWGAMKPTLVLALLGAVGGVGGIAGATPYVPKQELQEWPGQPARLGVVPRRLLTRSDALAALERIAGFEQMMQFAAPCSDPNGADCNFGGQIEVESGEGHAIIESDNTQEAIWDWSFYRRMGGTMSFAPQIENAWGYLSRFPGYDEFHDGCTEGCVPNYYSIYNCGWGLRAVLEYEAATADRSHHGYGDTCADHVAQNAHVTTASDLIDVAPAGWAASGLWLWADANGRADLKARAADIGGQVKAWLDLPNRGSRPASRTWAVTGGAAVYGVLHSYMKEHPAELGPWVQIMAPRLGGWIDESMVTDASWHDWRNAFNAWNMLAQFAVAEALGTDAGQPHLDVALDIYGRLLAQDTDMDGGVPGSQQRPATEDQSWITSFAAYFGVQYVLALPEPSPPDAGAPDAEVDAALAPDAAPAPDAGGGTNPGNPGTGGDSGGCTTASSGGAGSGWLSPMAALLLVALSHRRRRR
jgi:MYXO-CTERM domain-containing protein